MENQPEEIKHPEQAPKYHDAFFGQPHSKFFKIIIVVLVEIILLVGAFALGSNVGFHKARYAVMWAKNYSNNFPAPTGSNFVVIPPQGPGQFFAAHGLDGSIISVAQSNLVIKDESGTEKTILITAQTSIRHGYDTLKFSDLKPNQEIVVLGEPNDQGQVQAKLIRVLDEQN